LRIKKAIEKSFINYKTFGSRSNERIKVLHGCVADEISEMLSNNFSIYSLHCDKNKSKEKKINGAFYKKNVDIAIEKSEKVLSVVSVKTIFTNYNQNKNNYFENFLGECINIKLAKINFYQLNIFRKNIVYNDKNGNFLRYEKNNINDTLQRYDKLKKVKSNFLADDCFNMIIEIKENDNNIIVKISEEIKKQYYRFLKNITTSIL
jgi:hypothetical protein